MHSWPLPSLARIVVSATARPARLVNVDRCALDRQRAAGLEGHTAGRFDIRGAGLDFHRAAVGRHLDIAALANNLNLGPAAVDDDFVAAGLVDDLDPLGPLR